jgi:hypothetical protein
VLSAEETAGRAASNVRAWMHWNEQAFSIPVPIQSSLRTMEWIDRRAWASHFTEALGQAAASAGMTGT